MALVLADRIQETTTTAGTGTITLAGAVTGYRSFATVGNGNTTYYTIAGQNTSEWEVGIGTYTSVGTTLARTTVLASSNAGSLVTFSAGTKDVFVTYPAGKSVYQDANGGVSVTSGASGIPLTLTGGASSSNILSLNGSANAKLFDFNSTYANGAWGTFSNSGTVFGYIGASVGLLGGLASDFALVAANALKLGTSATARITIASTGAITVAAPTSGNAFTIGTIGGATSPLVITGVASQTGANISTTTPSGTTNYWRLGQPGIVNWDIQNVGTTGEFRITNGAQIPYSVNGAGMLSVNTTTGNVAIAAPTSGVGLTVNGLSTGVDTLRLSASTNAAQGQMSFYVPAGQVAALLWDNGTSLTGTANSVALGGPAGALALQTSSTNRVVVGGSGNVTINAPTSGTTVTASGAAAQAVFSANVSGNGISLYTNNGTATGVAGYYSGNTTFFGSTSAHDMGLLTANTSRLTINSTGNVTINSPTSGATLTVSGDSVLGSDSYRSWGGTISGTLQGYGYALSTPYNGGFDTLALTSNAYNTTTSNWIYRATAPAGQYQIFSGVHKFNVAISGTAATAVTWNTAMQIANAGNVTINAPTSGAALTLNNTFGNYWLFGGDGTSTFGAYSGSGVYMGTASNHALTFFTNSYTNQRMTIGSGGNVSINSPTSGIALTVQELSGSPTIAAGNIRMGFNVGLGTSTHAIYATAGNGLNVGTDGVAATTLYTNAVARMQIGSAGNVTINAPTSGAALTVNGIVDFDSTPRIGYLASTDTFTEGGLTIPNYGIVWGVNSTISAGVSSNISGYSGIALFTAGSKRVLVGGAGNVTINAPSSGTALSIAGGGLSVANPNATSNVVAAFTNATAGTSFSIAAPTIGGGYIAGSAAGDSVLRAESGSLNIGSVSGNLNIGTASRQNLQVAAAGNVAISAATSGTTLNVGGGTTTGRVLEVSGSVAVYESASRNTPADFDWSSTTFRIRPYGASGAGFELHTTPSGGGTTSRLAINSTGNVTINAPTSGTALTVTGPSSGFVSILNDVGGNGVTWRNATNTSGFDIGLLGGTGDGTAYIYQRYSASLIFGTANSNRVSISSTGNVYINATSSGSPLTVNAGTGTTALTVTNSVSGSGSEYFQTWTNLVDSNLFVRINQTGAATKFAAIESTTATPINIGTNNITRFVVGAAGNVTVNAPTSGVGLTVRAVSGTHSTQIADSANTLYDAGYLGVPQNSQTTAYTLVAADRGKHISITTGGVTVPSAIFSAGDTISIYNNSGSSQTITQGTSVTMYLGGTATTGNRTLAQRGVCTVLCVASNTFVISGAGLT